MKAGHKRGHLMQAAEPPLRAPLSHPVHDLSPDEDPFNPFEEEQVAVGEDDADVQIVQTTLVESDVQVMIFATCLMHYWFQ